MKRKRAEYIVGYDLSGDACIYVSVDTGRVREGEPVMRYLSESELETLIERLPKTAHIESEDQE